MWPNCKMKYWLKKQGLQNLKYSLEEVKVVRPQYADYCCRDMCQTLVHWEVVKSREVFYTENVTSFIIQIDFCKEYTYFQNYCHWVIQGQCPDSLLVSSWQSGVCGQSTLELHPAASQHPPNRGLSCSSGRCAEAH